MSAHILSAATTVEVLPAVRVTATGNGTGVDCTTYDGTMLFTLASSAGGGTSPTLDVKLQSSDTLGGTYADITGATFTQVTDAADAHETIKVNVAETAGFIRAVKTVTGTSPTFDCAVTAVGLKQYR